MTGTAHLSAGAGIGSLTGLACAHPVAGAIAGAFAALLPDIDHPGSMLGRFARQAAVRMEEQYGHRESFTHTVPFALTSGLAVGLFPAIVLHCFLLVTAGVLGCLSHLALDAVTRSGIHPFRVSLPRLKRFSGSRKSLWENRWNQAADRWNAGAGQAEEMWGVVHLRGSVTTGQDWREGAVIIGGWLLVAMCIFVI